MAPRTGTAALTSIEALVGERGLVVLAGAGISMAPPTSLPSWWDFNSAVLRALADRLDAYSSQGWAGGRLETLTARRQSLHAFTPDFMAQVMVEEAGHDYFRVLQVLDTDRINANHLALADLARAGVLRAVITTNFDRLTELALDELGVDHQVFADSAGFDELPTALDRTLDRTRAPLPVIKVHGTVADPSTMVDTLAQRVAGRPETLERAIRALLAESPCASVGFSGADLAYDPDYLGLRSAAEHGCGLFALVQPNAEPLPALRDLITSWGAGGAFVEGTLPEWLVGLRDALGVDAAPATVAPADAPDQSTHLAQLTDGCRAWVDSLGTMAALNMFTALVDINEDDEQMLRYLMFFKRYYMSTEDGQSASRYRFEYNIGRRLLDRGLIGTIDPHEAGLVPRGVRDVEATSYADAIQFLLRGARSWNEPGVADNVPGSALIEAEVDAVRCLALKFGHGHVDGNVAQLVQSLPDDLTTDPRRALETCWLAAEFAEEFGQIGNGLNDAAIAYQFAGVLGDEPRRAAIAARGARLMALAGEYDEAMKLVDEALKISTRLALPVLRGDALAAQGMVDVLRSHDRDAVAPLVEATGIFAGHHRRPRLTYALCDLVRAHYYSGDVDAANEKLARARRLADVLPGLAVQVALAELELLRADEQTDQAGDAATELLEVAKELKHATGVRRAERALEELRAEP